MNTTVEYLSELDGIDLEGSIPCQAECKQAEAWVTCRQESVARLHGSCACGYVKFFFTCKGCLDVFMNIPDKVRCPRCNLTGNVASKNA